MQNVFLVDVDDTLLNTDAIKNDLFISLSQAWGAGRGLQESRREIQSLYDFFKKTNDGLFSYRGFEEFLVKHFAGYRDEPDVPSAIENRIRDSFKIDFKKYLLPGALDLVQALSAKGRIIFWTTGDPRDQKAKLLSALSLKEDLLPLIEFNQLPENPSDIQKANLALVDLQKELHPASHLAQIRELVGLEVPISIFDNQAKIIAAAVQQEDPYLKAYWFDYGRQRDKELATSMRETKEPQGFKRYTSLEDIRDNLKLEGTTTIPESGAKPSTLEGPGLK